MPRCSPSENHGSVACWNVCVRQVSAQGSSHPPKFTPLAPASVIGSPWQARLRGIARNPPFSGPLRARRSHII